MSEQGDQFAHSQGEEEEYVEQQDQGEYEGEGEEYVDTNGYDPQADQQQQDGEYDDEGAAHAADENGEIDYDQYDPVHHVDHYPQDLQEGIQADGDEYPEQLEGSQGNDNSQSIPYSTSNQHDLPQNCIVSPLAARNQVVFTAGGPTIVQTLSHSRVGTVPYNGPVTSANGEVEMEAYERTVIEYEPQEKTFTVMVPVEKKITEYRPKSTTTSVIYSSQLRTQPIVPATLLQSGLRVTPVVLPAATVAASKPASTVVTSLHAAKSSNVLYQSQLVTRPFVAPASTSTVLSGAPLQFATSGSTRSLLSVQPKTVPVTATVPQKFTPPASVFVRPTISSTPSAATQFVKPLGLSFASPTLKTLPQSISQASTLRAGSFLAPSASVVSRPPASFLQQTLQPRPSFSQTTLPIQTIRRQPVFPGLPLKQ